MPVPEECFETYAHGRPYHAALVDLRGDSSPHGHHDYYEVMVIAGGEGGQRLPGGTQKLRRGDTVLVRPGDQHGLSGTGPAGMRFYNIAFPAATWHGFAGLAALGRAGAWDESPLPPLSPAAPDQAADRPSAATEACRLALERFHDSPTTLDLIRFWTQLVPLLPPAVTSSSGAPTWLVAACTAMRQEEHLREGLPRMLALAHLSPAHLSSVVASRTVARRNRSSATKAVGVVR